MALNVLPPACGGAVVTKAADVEGVAADGRQRFAFRKGLIRDGFGSTPTRHGMVLADTAGEGGAQAEGNEAHTLGR